jgi:N-acetylglucosamine-6-sulfatase
MKPLVKLVIVSLFGMVGPLLQAGVSAVPSEIVPQALSGTEPRNVVFILSDDHRYDAMSFMDHPFARTPQMDKMAAEGAHMANAFVTTSLCSPSRASILTGLYTFRHRVIDNNRKVPDGTIFFPQYLQKAGYATAYIGKWHMGDAADEPRPGFDHWVSFEGQGRYLPGPRSVLNVDGEHVPQKGYITDELTDYAVNWLEKQSGSEQPFFLYLSHKAVHANFTPAERHAGELADLPWERPATFEVTEEMMENQPRWLKDQRNSWHGVDFPYHSNLDVEKYYKAYCETLIGVDDSIGRVMDQLEKMGIKDETLVIYMGDNGFMFGEHGLIDKRVAYETSIRVPMLMRCPDLFEGGTVVNEVVANIDMGPTIMDAMGLETPAHMDGQSALPLLQGKEIAWRDFFLYVYYWEKNFPQSPTVFSLRGDRYKYITYYGLWDADELYDLQTDPGETINLCYNPDYKAVVEDMEARLYQMMDELGGMEIPMNAPRGNSSNKRLRSRGGQEATDFPEPMVVDEPINKRAM